MKTTSRSPGSGPRTTSSSAVVFLHGHQLDRNLARAVTAEAAGTFVLVLAITSAAVAAALSRPVAGTPYWSLAVPVAGGLALAIAVAGLGHISGTHLNPAVTLGLAASSRFPWPYAPGYVLAQFAGAAAAAAVTWGLYGDQARSIAALGAPAPAAGVAAGRVLAAEAVVTFVLVLVVVAVATDTRVPRGIAAMAIGGPRGRHRDQRHGQRRGRQPGPGDRADDPGRPVHRLVGLPRGATGRRRGSCRPLRQVPAGRQHTCLAMTPADDHLSPAPGPGPDDDHPDRGWRQLAACGMLTLNCSSGLRVGSLP
jgi:hypothetical protein